MRYIIIPIEDAKVVMTADEIDHARKSTDGTLVIVHEEILVRKRNALGLATLSSEETGVIEWTYPVYEYKSKELNELLASKEWTAEEEILMSRNAPNAVKEDDITYKKGMVLEAGKTYSQYGKQYRCIRGSENPVSGNLKDLTIYVEPIK